MASDLYDGAADALAEAIEAYGQTFRWQGNDYGCIITRTSVTTSKAFFSGRIYPQPGDPIRIGAEEKERQVTRLSGAGQELVPGGLIETEQPFVDDPTNPALVIGYDTFINR